jgi:hypothetical protein
MLYRSTDRLSRRGAPVKNLAHSASFHCMENIAPSNPGIKQLGSGRQRHQVGAMQSNAIIGDGVEDQYVDVDTRTNFAGIHLSSSLYRT